MAGPLTPRHVFRYFETDGVPDSGPHDPVKSEIIQLLEQLFGTSRGGWIVTGTLAELNGITPENETDGGVVLTGTGAGYYEREGGAWVFGRGFPDTFAKVTLSGSGTAQTGVVGAGVNPANVEMFYAFVQTDNDGPLTLSIAGEAPRQVVNLAGNPLAAGEWTGTVMFARDGPRYRLLLDAGALQATAILVGQAEAAAAVAQQGQGNGLVEFDTRSLAEAWPGTDPMPDTIVIRGDASVSDGKGGTFALGAASDNTMTVNGQSYGRVSLPLSVTPVSYDTGQQSQARTNIGLGPLATQSPADWEYL